MAAMWGLCGISGDWFEIGLGDSEEMLAAAACPGCGAAPTRCAMFVDSPPEPGVKGAAPLLRLFLL